MQVRLTDELKRFIRSSTKSYGKAKLVLKHNKFWVETSDLKVTASAVSDAMPVLNSLQSVVHDN